ncbi:hypothetical protein, partial [Pseudomonas aeruginosa]|uniref:hypothetical protein n=1 Tax=Pseudomonas aeruginosa TaxID=287 RepID=UPI00301DF1B1
QPETQPQNLANPISSNQSAIYLKKQKIPLTPPQKAQAERNCPNIPTATNPQSQAGQLISYSLHTVKLNM